MRDNRSFELRGRDVHVRSVRLEASDTAVSQLELSLAPDELERAARFRFDYLRHSFVVARGTLRALLGRYLLQPPADLQFEYGANGKPTVRGTTGIAFNVSHAGDIAAFAFTIGCELGIDLEPIRSIPEMGDVARRFFCSAEVEELASLPQDQKDLGFYSCWTRRESFIKARGDKLATMMDQLQVSLQPGAPPCFVQVPHEAGSASAWSLHDLDLAPGNAAALAYRDLKRRIELFPLIGVEDLLIT
jgi:4'-phosphopantetheinyl transferase